MDDFAAWQVTKEIAGRCRAIPAEQTFDRLRADAPEQRHLAVVASGISFVDLQGGTTLAQEAKRRKAAGGYQKRDRSICATCERRIFTECRHDTDDPWGPDI